MNKHRFACLAGGAARAGSFAQDSIVFTGSVTSNTATLTIQCTDAKASVGFISAM